MTIAFRDIEFGHASAEVESAESPELLLNAFLDSEDIVNQTLSGKRFLILGAKGSGKSAIGLHLELDAKRHPERFVNTYFLSDLSYKTLGSIVQENIEPELKFPRAWSFVLLLTLLNSLTKDQGASFSDPNLFLRTVKALREAGLLPTEDLSSIVGKVRMSKFELSAFNVKVIAGGEREQPDTLLSSVTQRLKELISECSTKSRHLLIIDGLDDVLLSESVQLQGLSGLILESSRLNQHFRQNNLPFKIVILCRTDIYERIPGPNQNKIRQDLALELLWFEGSDADKSRLVTLAKLRARLADPSLKNIFHSFLPWRIGGKKTTGFLLKHSRHTPRDFLQLLRYLQQSSDQTPMDHPSIYAGLKAYSERYFLPEIRDELDGLIKREELDTFFSNLFQFPDGEFTFDQLQQHFQEIGSARTVDLERVLTALYSCSALGNVHQSGSFKKLRFHYAKPGSALIREQNMIFHPALRMALGIGAKR
jgi:hypothetical protein